MNIELSLQQFIQGVSKAEKASGRNLTLPVLACLKLEAKENKLTLVGTNLNIGIETMLDAKVENEGVVIVSAQVLNQTVSQLKGESIKIYTEGQLLVLETEQNTTKLHTQTADDFPVIPKTIEDHSLIVSIKSFIEGIRSVSYAAALSDIKPEISSVYMYTDDTNLIFVSTDSFRLAEKKIVKVSGDCEGIILPIKNALDISRIISDDEEDEKLYIGFSDNQIVLKTRNTYITSRLVQGSFPDYKRIIPVVFTTQARVLLNDFKKAMKITQLFTDKFHYIELQFSSEHNEIVCTSSNKDVGETSCKTPVSFTGNDCILSLNHRYIAECLGSFVDDTVVLQLEDVKKPLVIQGGHDTSFTYLIMPMSR